MNEYTQRETRVQVPTPRTNSALRVYTLGETPDFNDIYKLTYVAREMERELYFLTTQDLFTSEHWCNLLDIQLGIDIIDPDGWVRGPNPSDFDISFNQEKISFREFRDRMCKSTTLHPSKLSRVLYGN